MSKKDGNDHEKKGEFLSFSLGEEFDTEIILKDLNNHSFGTYKYFVEKYNETFNTLLEEYINEQGQSLLKHNESELTDKTLEDLQHFITIYYTHYLEFDKHMYKLNKKS